MMSAAAVVTRTATKRLFRIISNTRSFSAGTSVGVIGLGNMGGHMARNLVKAGHSVFVYDRKLAFHTNESNIFLSF